MQNLVIYSTENKELIVGNETNLLELCIKNEIPIDHVCEGGASCGTCRVIILDSADDLPKRNSLEQEMATDRNFPKEERLACQLGLKKGFSFKLPKDNL